MAKTIDSEGLALDRLAALLSDPAGRVLHGGKGIVGVFPGASAAEKAAAQLCLERGWLAPTGEFQGKGRTRKEVYRLTPAGAQAVLARSDPTDLLRSLRDGLEKLDGKVSSAVQEVQARLADALAAMKSAMQAALEPMAALTTLGDIKQTIALTLERVKPVNAAEILGKLSAPPPPSASSSPRNADDWHDVVLRLAAEQRQRNPFQRLTLSQLYERLKNERPGLSLGEFHDGLRRLHQEKRIRLGPYTQALATLDDPNNALYLDREVKYYVELP